MVPSFWYEPYVVLEGQPWLLAALPELHRRTVRHSRDPEDERRDEPEDDEQDDHDKDRLPNRPHLLGSRWLRGSRAPLPSPVRAGGRHRLRCACRSLSSRAP